MIVCNVWIYVLLNDENELTVGGVVFRPHTFRPTEFQVGYVSVFKTRSCPHLYHWLFRLLMVDLF